jgi:hypothetical protein
MMTELENNCEVVGRCLYHNLGNYYEITAKVLQFL